MQALINSSRPECQCRPLSFELEPSQMRSLCLRSRPPSDMTGWAVELDRTEASLGWGAPAAVSSYFQYLYTMTQAVQCCVKCKFYIKFVY